MLFCPSPNIKEALRGIACIVLLCLLSCSSPGGNRFAIGNDASLGPVSPTQLLAEVGLRTDLIRAGTVGRKIYRRMTPQYVTIHSTQNYTGDAYNHALALKRGALKATKRVGGNRIGYLTWHFTVQDNVAIQHLPCREQGEHADFDGVGNNYSIGIEMCEHRGNNIPLTVEKTARLAAYLCYSYQISPSKVVPHYHWPRYGTSPLHKDCPHFLLENGKPGRTWNWFLSRVRFHLSRITPGPVRNLG